MREFVLYAVVDIEREQKKNLGTNKQVLFKETPI